MMNRKMGMRNWALALVLALAANAGQAANVGSMTPEKMKEYYQLFNAQDVSYQKYLAPDVEFNHVSAGMLRGPKPIVDFYTKMWQGGVVESRELTFLVIDNERGTMAAELSVYVKVKPGLASGVTPSGKKLNAGEMLKGASVVLYTFKGDKITSIRGPSSGPAAWVQVKE